MIRGIYIFYLALIVALISIATGGGLGIYLWTITLVLLCISIVLFVRERIR